MNIRMEKMFEKQTYNDEERKTLELIWEHDTDPAISLLAEERGLKYNPNHYERGGVYSNLEIKEALYSGHIRIFPFDQENLKLASYDVTLGEWFYRTDVLHNRTDYNFHSERDIKRYFGEPLEAVTYGEWSKIHKTSVFDDEIMPDDRVIVLNPGERILAHTNEFIGIRAPGTTQMQARSSAGRNGIVVCKDAGWGDPGYLGRWTMEIQNDNKERVAFRVGERLAQLIFITTGPVYGEYGQGGKYYQSSSLREDVRKWQPLMMLPRTHKDKFTQPVITLSLIEKAA